jgi:hypothetical protein
LTRVRVAPASEPALDWGADEALGRFARALAELPDAGRIDNADFALHALQLPDRAFLIAEPRPERPQTWLLSLRSAYGRVAREEAESEAGELGAAFGVAARLAEAWLAATDADRVVWVNHPLLSTSLWDGWDGAEIHEALPVLRERFPRRALAFRSLNAWSDAALLERLKAAGARLLPSRVVWTVDDVRRDWLAKRDAKRDLRKIPGGGWRAEQPQTLTDADWACLRTLYRQLYIGRHSAHNPDYSEAFLRAGQASGFLRFHTLVAADDGIAAFVATVRSGGILTSPMLGYDLSQPRNRGLYRMAMSLPGLEAAKDGLKVNHSAGAGMFKRFRGARPQLEYTALFDAHLPSRRRLGYAGLERALKAITPSLMRIATA